MLAVIYNAYRRHMKTDEKRMIQLQRHKMDAAFNLLNTHEEFGYAYPPTTFPYCGG